MQGAERLFYQIILPPHPRCSRRLYEVLHLFQDSIVPTIRMASNGFQIEAIEKSSMHKKHIGVSISYDL